MGKIRVWYGFLGLVMGLVISFIISEAQSFIDPAKAGVSLWILLVASIFLILFEAIPAVIFLKAYYSEWKKIGYINWEKVGTKILYYITGTVVGLILGLGVVWARSINLKEAGITLWIFLIVGSFIVLLQLIPAIIIFVSLVGTGTKISYDKISVKEENPAVKSRRRKRKRSINLRTRQIAGFFYLFFFAAGLGFGPRLMDSESIVLPLDDPAMVKYADNIPLKKA